ncbi:hypothetical protein M758_1G239600 [Ceratodon purpureus]|nr:hypothetical protein M758_1G239600 [Ceratodon purpureus]
MFFPIRRLQLMLVVCACTLCGKFDSTNSSIRRTSVFMICCYIFSHGVCYVVVDVVDFSKCLTDQVCMCKFIFSYWY